MTGQPIYHMDEGEIVDLHGGLAAWLASYGLKGPALDEALADTFTAASQHIDAHRETEMRRREAIKVVGGVDA